MSYEHHQVTTRVTMNGDEFEELFPRLLDLLVPNALGVKGRFTISAGWDGATWTVEAGSNFNRTEAP